MSLSNRVTEESLLRLQPKTGTVCAVTQVSLFLHDIGDDGLAMVTLVILFLLSNDNGLASETATPKVASGGGGEGGTVETDAEARINYTNISRDRSGTSQLQNCCRNYFFLFASIS